MFLYVIYRQVELLLWIQLQAYASINVLQLPIFLVIQLQIFVSKNALMILLQHILLIVLAENVVQHVQTINSTNFPQIFALLCVVVY